MCECGDDAEGWGGGVEVEVGVATIGCYLLNVPCKQNLGVTGYLYIFMLGKTKSFNDISGIRE